MKEKEQGPQMKTLTWHVWYIYPLMSMLYTKKYNGEVRVAQVVQVEREYGGHGRSWSDWRGMKRKGAEELWSQGLGKRRLTSWTEYRYQTRPPRLTLLLSLLHSSLSLSSHLWEREQAVLLHSLICFQESQIMLWFFCAMDLECYSQAPLYENLSQQHPGIADSMSSSSFTSLLCSEGQMEGFIICSPLCFLAARLKNTARNPLHKFLHTPSASRQDLLPSRLICCINCLW